MNKSIKYVIFLICLVLFAYIITDSYDPVTMKILPIPYAIPDDCIVDEVPTKTRILSEVIPNAKGKKGYSYGPGQESEYYQQYRESRFAITMKKGGWDCMRHYEIMAAGCIPIFQGIEDCPQETLVSIPKELLLEANQRLLPWKETPEHKKLYNSYARRILEHCRSNCSTTALARQFLDAYKGRRVQSVLMLTCDTGTNYSREALAIGLRHVLGDKFIDAPRIDPLYDDVDLSKAYGNGFSYGGRLPASQVIDRSNVQERIRAKEFDLILYGKVGMDETELGSAPYLPFWADVSTNYPKEKIAFLYGGDRSQSKSWRWGQHTQHLYRHARLGTCFVRELD